MPTTIQIIKYFFIFAKGVIFDNGTNTKLKKFKKWALLISFTVSVAANAVAIPKIIEIANNLRIKQKVIIDQQKTIKVLLEKTNDVLNKEELCLNTTDHEILEKPPKSNPVPNNYHIREETIEQLNRKLTERGKTK